MAKCKLNGWILLHIITLINSCIFINQITKMTPFYIDNTINPVIYYGFFPFIASVVIHIIYKYDKYRNYEPVYRINV